jgi:hypothetical protein
MQKVVPVGQSGRALCEDARADPGQHQAQKGQEPMARGKGSQMPARSGKNGDSASELSLSQTFIYIYIYIYSSTNLSSLSDYGAQKRSGFGESGT